MPALAKPFTKHQEGVILAWYDEGHTMADLTREFDWFTNHRQHKAKALITRERGEYLPLKARKIAQQKERVVALLKERHTFAHIVRETGLSRPTIQAVSEKLDLTKEETVELPIAEIIKTWSLGELSKAELAQHYNTSVYAITKLINDNKPQLDGNISYRAAKVLENQKGTRRYIFTCAQNNTQVNKKVWDGLQALAKHYDAEIFVASFNYNRAAYGANAVKRNTNEDVASGLWYDPEITKYLDKSDQRIQVAQALMWCGEVNLSPTLKKPLTGFEDYTQTHSSIFPHPRLSMKSIATISSGAKLCYTTGTITQRNYIQKGAGLKAEFHHGYGGLLVEVNESGSFFVRQLVATDDGCIQDLNVLVKNGKVESRTARVAALNWGDIHVAYLQEEQKKLCWGKNGILDTLKPEYQFFHDTLDFRARNHHDIKNPHSGYQKFINGMDDVQKEIRDAAQFLDYAQRESCVSMVVESNHDNAHLRWLQNLAYDYRNDPLNALYFLECQHRVYSAIFNREPNFNLMEWAVRRHYPLDRVRFLGVDESFVYKLIEFGIHGHSGPNGSRGSPAAFSRLGFPCNIGHFHSAEILDGVYVAGVSASLNMDYNHGPSSWGHSHIVTYPNGNRAMLTTWRGEWRAK